VTVRRATVADTAAARTIVGEYNDAVGVVVRDDGASFHVYLDGPGGMWFAELGGEVVGCVVMRPLPSVGPAACEVKRLYVGPDRRGLGLAADLMDALESSATASGYQYVYLDTFDDLADAVRFYERRGYARVARYNDNPQATIFMRRELVSEQPLPG
jgi:ribosomal protein S18 acetylase RimI-like enzyme